MYWTRSRALKSTSAIQSSTLFLNILTEKVRIDIVANRSFLNCVQAIHSNTPCVEVWQTSNLRPLRLGEEKKEERKKQETTGQKYNGPPYYIGRP